MTQPSGNNVLTNGATWAWPVVGVGVYPEPYPFRYDDGRGVCPITTSLEEGRCWVGNPPTCPNAPAYVARYDCGPSDEEGLVCVEHAASERLSSWLVSIRSLTAHA